MHTDTFGSALFLRLHLRDGSFDQFEESTDQAIPLRFFVTGVRYRLLASYFSHASLRRASRPNLLLGSDAYGRDQFSRILYGGQISLLAGLLGRTHAVLRCAHRSDGGYYGGWRDGLLMRVAELFVALPWLYLLFALRAFLPLASASASIFLIILVIGAVGWARPARLVRGVVLSARERDFVRAARASAQPMVISCGATSCRKLRA